MIKVQLFACTQHPEGLSLKEQVAYCARVSNPGNQNNHETADKLIDYLIRHAHWSPFEMVNVVLEVEAPRDITRQLLRHRSFSFQEFSQRYAEAFEYAEREARMQDHKNRQASWVSDDHALQNEWLRKTEYVREVAEAIYRWALDKGIAKECARVVLPEGMTMSRLYVNGTMRSWIHYCRVRTDKSTQLEHRQLALACAEVLESVWPGFKYVAAI